MLRGAAPKEPTRPHWLPLSAGDLYSHRRTVSSCDPPSRFALLRPSRFSVSPRVPLVQAPAELLLRRRRLVGTGAGCPEMVMDLQYSDRGSGYHGQAFAPSF